MAVTSGQLLQSEAETQTTTPSFDFFSVEKNKNSDGKKSIAIASGKGGVGKTLLAVNIAYYLSQQKNRVTIIDLDLKSPSLRNFFNSHNCRNTLKDLLLSPEMDINELTHETPFPNCKMICGSSATLGMSEKHELIVSRILDNINSLESEFIIFDLGSGLQFNDVQVFLKSDIPILIGTPEPASILENFFFLKLCVLIGLENILQAAPKKLHIVREAFERSDQKTHKKIKAIIQQLKKDYHKNIINDILKFDPMYILNMTSNENDYPFALTVEIALKEMFDVQLKQLGTIPYSMNLRNLISQNNFFLSKDDGQENNVFENLYHELLCNLNNDMKSYPKIDLKKINPRKNDFSYIKNQLICSSHCSLWDNCPHQRGGYPCKIKYIGFINSN